MKLISITDFVLGIGKQTEIKTYEWYFLKVFDYAQFLNHSLTLDMFIGDKALFEGFEKEDGYICFDYVFIYEVDKLKLYTIEDMLSEVYLSDQDINLTPYATKLLGL